MQIGKLHINFRFGSPEGTFLQKMLHVCIDMYDEPGDPSGLYMNLFGQTIEIYYPTYVRFGFVWSLGGKFWRTG